MPDDDCAGASIKWAESNGLELHLYPQQYDWYGDRTHLAIVAGPGVRFTVTVRREDFAGDHVADLAVKRGEEGSRRGAPLTVLTPNDEIEFLYNEGEIKDDCRRATKEILERMDNAYNFNEELNQFGHNYELNPTPDSLISVFNSVRCLLNGMFAYEMKKAGQRRQIYGHATDVQLCSSAPLCAIRAAKAASPATCRR